MPAPWEGGERNGAVTDRGAGRNAYARELRAQMAEKDARNHQQPRPHQGQQQRQEGERTPPEGMRLILHRARRRLSASFSFSFSISVSNLLAAGENAGTRLPAIRQSYPAPQQQQQQQQQQPAFGFLDRFGREAGDVVNPEHDKRMQCVRHRP
jgi:hypothetical protein